jgi:hypothetical protein
MPNQVRIKTILIVFSILTIFSISSVHGEEKGGTEPLCSGLEVKGDGSATTKLMPCIPEVPVSKEEREFEGKIRTLLYLNDGDTYQGWGSEEKVDMPARNNFFSKEGWKQYQEYITWQKKELTDVKAGRKFQYQALTLPFNSQQYSNSINGLKTFFAKGAFYYGTGDVFAVRKPFEIKISYMDVNQAPKILIKDWKIIPVKGKE